jgi:hypothetical protein
MTTRPGEDPEQRRALEALAAAAAVAAPERLRRRIEAERVQAVPLARQRRRGLSAAVAVIAAALTASAFFLFPSGVSDTDLIGEVADLHGRSAALELPPPRSLTLLGIDAEGLAFPRLRPRGWRAVGFRTDTLHGRQATTVFYRRGSRRIGYTILSGRPLRPPADARLERRGEVDYPTLTVDGRTVVTWPRSGLTVVLSGRRVSHRILVNLASWTGGGTIIP